MWRKRLGKSSVKASLFLLMVLFVVTPLAGYLLGSLVWSVILAVMGIIVVSVIINMIHQKEEHLRQLLEKLDQHNRHYIYHDEFPADTSDADAVIESTMVNIQKANDMMIALATGNPATEWNGLVNTNRASNKVNMAGNLEKVQDQLRSVKLMYEQHTWITDGLQELTEITHRYQDLQGLGQALARRIVSHVGATQGCFFTVTDESKDEYLKLVSCYPDDQKRLISKVVMKGEGLAGQCWSEGEPLLLTQVPEDYVHVSTGHVAPKYIFITPIKIQGKTYGVLELALLENLNDTQLEFINKACERIAASMAAIKALERTQGLLHESKLQADRMKKEVILLERDLTLERKRSQELEELIFRAEERIKGMESIYKRFNLN